MAQMSALATAAIALMTLALDAVPHPARAQTHTLQDCMQDNSARLALRACTALLQQTDLKPEDAAAIYAARGRAWLREEEPEEAISDFTRALELKPADPVLLSTLLKDRARAHTRLAAHKQAADDWSALIALDPSLEPAYLNRAQAMLAAGDTAAALADFDTVLARNARSVEARIGRGNVFVALDQKADAYSEFDLAQELAPGGWQVYHARGVAADKWGDTKLAIENYTRTLHLNNVNWDARRALRRLGLVNIP